MVRGNMSLTTKGVFSEIALALSGEERLMTQKKRAELAFYFSVGTFCRQLLGQQTLAFDLQNVVPR